MKRIILFALISIFALSFGDLLAQKGKRRGGGGNTKNRGKGIGIFAILQKKGQRSAIRSRNQQISRFTGKSLDVKAKKHFIVGGAIGVSNYFGDLAPRSRRGSSDVRLTRTYTSGFIQYRIHPNIQVRATAAWSRIKGDDFSVQNISNPNAEQKGRYVRNLSFRNDIKEVNMIGIFELFPTDRGYLRRSFLSPYGMLGLSVFHHNPRGLVPVDGRNLPDKGKWVPLQPLGTEGQHTGLPGTPRPYSRIQIGIPIGFGLRYRLTDKLDLGFEISYRFLFTDYLDDVSGKYPDSATTAKMFQKNPLSVAMSNRTTESRSASSNELRTKLVSWAGRGREPISGAPNDGLWTRYIGSESGAEPRGNKKRDYYVVTSFNVSYYIELKEKAPKFR